MVGWLKLAPESMVEKRKRESFAFFSFRLLGKKKEVSFFPFFCDALATRDNDIVVVDLARAKTEEAEARQAAESRQAAGRVGGPWLVSADDPPGFQYVVPAEELAPRYRRTAWDDAPHGLRRGIAGGRITFSRSSRRRARG